MGIYTPSSTNLKKAASVIKAGGVISFPTETVYGLGADAYNPIAVAKIFEIKNRPFFDPIIVHIADFSQLDHIAVNIDNKIEKLIHTFWPGPLTIVVERSNKIPDIVTSGLHTVGIRMPNHPIALDLIKRAETPIAAPSANPFGYLSPTKAEHVLEQLADKIDLIIDGGDCSIGVESTIIKIDSGNKVLLRPGGLPLEEIEAIIGSVDKSLTSLNNPEAPGQLPYHYSPTTKISIVNNISEIDFSNNDAGFLLFKKPFFEIPHDRTEILSHNGDIREAASKLFSSLHRLDKLNKKIIFAESVPETGLGLAIMDRLRKASKK